MRRRRPSSRSSAEIVGTSAPQIVSSSLEIGDRIGARVVAEGIESEEEYQVVRRLGVRLAQGYLFGAPAPTFPPRAAGAQRNH